jgi:hypothetical protein
LLKTFLNLAVVWSLNLLIMIIGLEMMEVDQLSLILLPVAGSIGLSLFGVSTSRKF